MHFIEAFLDAKVSQGLNEDQLVTGPHFAAVIDGATDKSGFLVDGKPGGWHVSRVLANLLRDSRKLAPGASYMEFEAAAMDAVNAFLADAGWPTDVSRPCAVLCVYSSARREIWRIGDVQYSIEGVVSTRKSSLDMRTSQLRAEVIRLALDMGLDEDAILQDGDLGRAAIMPILSRQHLLANKDHPLGYPVVNGTPIPASLRENPVSVPMPSDVIIASDGFDVLCRNLATTMEAQKESYRRDPLRIGINGGHASTKAVPKGRARHDDQSFIRFVT